MRTFKVTRWDRLAAQSSGSARSVAGFRAPGTIVLILQEGSGWVLGPDGDRQAIIAKTVVTWEAGDWVEYGGDGESELYWAADLSDAEWAARMARVSGTDAVH